MATAGPPQASEKSDFAEPSEFVTRTRWICFSGGNSRRPAFDQPSGGGMKWGMIWTLPGQTSSRRRSMAAPFWKSEITWSFTVTS